MHFEVWTRGLAALSVDCLVLGIFEEGTLTEEAQAVDAALGGRLRKLLARGDFSGRTGETLLLTDLPGIEATRVLLTGLGGRKSLARRPWRKALTAALSALARTRITSAAIAIERPPAKELDDYYLGGSRRDRRQRAVSHQRLEDGEEAEAPGAAEADGRTGSQDRCRGSHPGPGARCRCRKRRTRATRPRQPSCKRLHSYLSRRTGTRIGQTRHLPARTGARRGRDRTGENGVPAGGGSRQPSTAPLHRARAPRRQDGQIVRRAGWQGRHLRHRRHLAEGPRCHGRDEI